MDFLIKLLKKGFFECMLDEEIPRYARIISYILTNFCFVCAIIVMAVSTTRRIEVAGFIACLLCTLVLIGGCIFLNVRFARFYVKTMRKRREEYKQKMIENAKVQLNDSEEKFMTE